MTTKTTDQHRACQPFFECCPPSIETAASQSNSQDYKHYYMNQFSARFDTDTDDHDAAAADAKLQAYADLDVTYRGRR